MSTSEKYLRRKKERELDKLVFKAFKIAVEGLETDIKNRREEEKRSRTETRSH